MNPAHADLIRASFLDLCAWSGEVAEQIHRRLLERSPGTAALLPGRPSAERQRLVAGAGRLMTGAERMTVLGPALEQLALAHEARGVTPEDYLVARDVVLEVLAEWSGPLWREDVAEAWTEALNAVAGLLLGARESANAGAARRAA